jgi:hypothetical protein
MRNYLAAHHLGSFDPQEIEILCKAFDEVWYTVLASPSDYPTQDDMGQIREALLRYVADAAMDGESSPRRLKAAGLRRLENSRPPVAATGDATT